MRYQERGPRPDFLDNWEEWGQKWSARLNENPGASWSWRQVDGVGVNHALIPHLKEQTADHCSFCDAHPVRPPSDEPIEHFRPKRRFPLLAWQWENLFYCCRCCQEKNDEWDDALLKPDEPGYRCSDYFAWDFTTGEIRPRDDLAPELQHRAEVTIRLYGLNRHGHPQLRLRTQELRSAVPDWPLNKWPYRDFVEAEL